MFLPLLGLDCHSTKPQCTQMNRYCNPKPFQSPISQEGTHSQYKHSLHSHSPPAQINCFVRQFILLIFICLGFCLLNNNVWKTLPLGLCKLNIWRIQRKKVLFDTVEMKTSFFWWQIIHLYPQTKPSSGQINVRNMDSPDAFSWITRFRFE